MRRILVGIEVVRPRCAAGAPPRPPTCGPPPLNTERGSEINNDETTNGSTFTGVPNTDKGAGMALLNQSDPREAASELASWLAERMEGAHDVRVLDVEVPASSGLSNERSCLTPRGATRAARADAASLASSRPGLPSIRATISNASFASCRRFPHTGSCPFRPRCDQA